MSHPVYATSILGSSQIRVLVIEPSKKIKDPIVCRLQATTISQGLASFNFEALSYVWGDMTDKRDIRVNGLVMSVTTSLEKALRYLRNRKKSRRIWADAVCINQNDVLERNVQVQLMADIYRDAQKVLLWLGEPNDDIDKAFRWMKKYLPCGGYEIEDTQKQASKAYKKHPKSDAGMRRIIAHSYWHRMWTCQEFALASWDPVIICGHNSIEASYLWPALEAKDLLKDMSMLWTEDGKTNNGFTAEFPCIQTSILIRHAMMRRGQIPYRLTPSLGLFLSMTSPRGCEDPKDKIYALYGLVEAGTRLPPPNYSKPLEDVVKETVAFLINDQQDLDVYSFLGVQSRSGNNVGASWLPDLSNGNLKSARCPAHYVSRRICSRGGLKFSEDKASTKQGKVSADLSSLTLYGILIDRIKHVTILASSMNDLCKQITNLSEKLNARRPSVVSVTDETAGIQADQLSLGEIIQNLGGQSLWNTLTPRLEDMTDFEVPTNLSDEFASFIQGPDDKSGTHQALEKVLIYMFGRAFFITESGVIGVSSPDITDGDDLVLFHGLKIPYVVRKSRRHIGSKMQPYHMIGGAYVSGIMLGEISPVDGLFSRLTEVNII